jgi:hypothetical protein
MHISRSRSLVHTAKIPAPATDGENRWIFAPSAAKIWRCARIAACFAVLLSWLSSVRSSPGEAGQHGGHRSAEAGQQLIGAWRLAAIEYLGPHGETVDPYYQAGSSGIIIYDSSGWMSVQITAPDRRKWEAQDVRVPRPVPKEDAALKAEALKEEALKEEALKEEALKAEAFDTYYSYFGTWDYDAATSVVTHHVKSSIIPAESGMDYAQMITLEGGRLIFSVRSGSPGTETVRRKIWVRLRNVASPGHEREVRP